MVTPLGRAIEFFREFGLFDIVLPFLLIFAIVFAVLEKTRILGVNKVGDEEIPNKNLNAMVAFVIAMIVVAAANIVSIINEALPNILLLLVVLISFLILAGIFAKTDEYDLSSKHTNIYTFFIFTILIGVIMIFLGAIREENGRSWLEITLNWITSQWQSPAFTSIIIVVIAVAAIYWLTKSGKPTEKSANGKGNGKDGKE